jgi:hypothetical protein
VRKGQNDIAISDYNRAIEINPKYAEAYFKIRSMLRLTIIGRMLI